MQNTWTEEKILATVGKTFHGPHHLSLTENGLLCIIFTRTAPGMFPMIGAYWNNEEWVPQRWTSQGTIFEGAKSDLNLKFVDDPTDKDAA